MGVHSRAASPPLRRHRQLFEKMRAREARVPGAGTTNERLPLISSRGAREPSLAPSSFSWLPAVRALATCALLIGFSAWAKPALTASTIRLVSKEFENPGPATDVVVAVNVNPANGVTAMDFTFDYD